MQCIQNVIHRVDGNKILSKEEHINKNHLNSEEN